MIRAIVTAPKDPARLVLATIPDPVGEVIVRVESVSLNQGEVRRALETEEAGWCPGWDFAGVVERSTTGPLRVGARVVGLLYEGAWKERVAVDSRFVAELPASLSAELAATLTRHRVRRSRDSSSSLPMAFFARASRSKPRGPKLGPSPPAIARGRSRPK